MNLLEFLGDFYSEPYASELIDFYSDQPSQYPFRFHQSTRGNGVLAYEVMNFDTIDLKVLAGDKGSLECLLEPLSESNLSIKVPSVMNEYVHDLESIGFKIVAGEKLLLMKRFGGSL